MASVVPRLDPVTASQLIARRRGGVSFFERLLKLFENEGEQLVEQIEAALAAGDAAKVRSGAHRLKGSACVVGALEVKRLTGRLGAQASEGRTPDRGIVEDLRREMGAFIEEARALEANHGGV